MPATSACGPSLAQVDAERAVAARAEQRVGASAVRPPTGAPTRSGVGRLEGEHVEQPRPTTAARASSTRGWCRAPGVSARADPLAPAAARRRSGTDVRSSLGTAAAPDRDRSRRRSQPTTARHSSGSSRSSSSRQTAKTPTPGPSCRTGRPRRAARAAGGRRRAPATTCSRPRGPPCARLDQRPGARATSETSSATRAALVVRSVPSRRGVPGSSEARTCGSQRSQSHPRRAASARRRARSGSRRSSCCQCWSCTCSGRSSSRRPSTRPSRSWPHWR